MSVRIRSASTAMRRAAGLMPNRAFSAVTHRQQSGPTRSCSSASSAVDNGCSLGWSGVTDHSNAPILQLSTDGAAGSTGPMAHPASARPDCCIANYCDGDALRLSFGWGLRGAQPGRSAHRRQAGKTRWPAGDVRGQPERSSGGMIRAIHVGCGRSVSERGLWCVLVAVFAAITRRLTGHRAGLS